MSKLTIIDYDWLVTDTGTRLHHAHIHIPDTHDDIVEALWDGYGNNVRLDCGRTVDRVSIPGMFSRLSMRRCDRCCGANGLPHGAGSPKNDYECRRILGMEAKDTA